MSLLLSNQNLAAAVVGTTGSVDLSGANAQTAYTDKPAHARLYNESGCGLQVNVGQRAIDVVPAGGWMELEIHPTDGQINWQVLYILPNAPVTRLISIFYKPEEDPPPLILGNSPIGLANSVAVNQVINDGNPTPTIVVEATPSGGSSSAKILNDGSGYLSGGLITFDAAGNESYAVAKRINLDGLSGTTSASAFLGAQVFGASSPLELYRVGDRIYIGSDNGITLRVGSYNDGTDKFLGSSTAYEWWFSALTTGLLSWRQSTNAPSAGTAITYGPVMLIPAVVAQAIRQSISVNTATTILTFSIPANGVYRISGGAYVNSTVNTKPTFKYSYTTPAGSNPGYRFMTQAGGDTVLDGSSVTVFCPPAVDLQLNPHIFQANTGTLDVIYQDPSGTVADVVSVIIERLA